MDPIKRAVYKKALLSDFYTFSLYFFKVLTGRSFISQPHHKLVCEVIQKVIDGDVERLIIVMPPRHSKSVFLSVLLPAYCFARCPYSNIISTSFSEPLVLDHSRQCQSIVSSDQFKEIFDVTVGDKESAPHWTTTGNGNIYSRPIRGNITGIGFARETDEFNGILLIDDPLKPLAAFSKLIREETNMLIPNTLDSRGARSNAPRILLQQRLNEKDPVAFLLNGGDGHVWDYINIPAIIDETTGSAEWYERDMTGTTHGRAIEYDLMTDYGHPGGALWPLRKTLDDLEALRSAHPYTFYSQYMGQPKPLGGGMLREEWLTDNSYKWTGRPFDDLEGFYGITKSFITADTAMTSKTTSDFSVFQWWAFDPDRGLYLLDQVRGRWEAPELQTTFEQFYDKCRGLAGYIDGKRRGKWNLDCAYIEEKASGFGLIQTSQRNMAMNIVPVKRNIDKVTRMNSVIPFISTGKVHLPEGHPDFQEILSECSSFTNNDTHSYDDQVDCLIEGVDQAFIQANSGLDFSTPW